MTKRKTPHSPVVLQMSQDIAQIEARIESLSSSMTAQQGHLTYKIDSQIDQALKSLQREPEAVGDVYNITVNDGGTLNLNQQRS